MFTLRGRRARIDPASYAVATGRCWNDPALDSLIDTLMTPGTRVAEKISLTLAELSAARGYPDRATLVARATCEHLLDADATLRELAASPTGDVRSDADVLGLLAQVLVQAAWKIRGRGDVETVPEEAWRPFHQILEEADEIGRACLDLVPGHPVGGVTRLTSGRGLGIPADEWSTRFDDARRLHPLLWDAHTEMLQVLCEKWYGSHALMFDFARGVADDATEGSPLGALLVQAHLEYMLEESWRVSPTDRRSMLEAADRWVAGGESALTHPHALAAHQLFAYGLEDDPERLRFHLQSSRGRMARMPWDYLADGEKVYRSMMAANGVRLDA